MIIIINSKQSLSYVEGELLISKLRSCDSEPNWINDWLWHLSHQRTAWCFFKCIIIMSVMMRLLNFIKAMSKEVNRDETHLFSRSSQQQLSLILANVCFPLLLFFNIFSMLKCCNDLCASGEKCFFIILF
jgi:hypothetical protein